MEVLIGSDPPPRGRARLTRRITAVLTVLGAALVVQGVLGVLLLHFLTPPAVGVQQGAAGASTVVPYPTPSTTIATLALTAGLSPLLAGLGSVLLAWRYPLIGWRIGYLGMLLLPLLTAPTISVRVGTVPVLGSGAIPVQFLLQILLLCLAGWRHSQPALWWMWALMLVPAALWLGPGWEDRAIASVVLTAVAAAVDATSSSQRARRALVVQSELTELEQGRRAVLEERARIARDLHDVVAHHLSLIAVQTETARYRLSTLDAALAEFSSISDQAREALTDMRRLLGVLRNEGPLERSPQPHLDDLPELIDASRRAGIAVDLSMPAVACRVSPGVGLCAYRIVQEALSNASRHASGAPVSVAVEEDGDVLRLLVNNGPGASAVSSPGRQRSGHGLLGMQERVALLGGSLSAGPSPDGGFAVVALLPLHDPVAPSTP
ncbi:MAG: sensor histidine kinase [Candidatus Dormibacteraeota bacterium]|nr:sensor histidine kinase [Candidatus Dormibacteraeota bacterium]